MLAVFSAAVFFVLPKKAFASTGINQELSFEGKIVNSSSGVNIPDATYNMEFKIYSGGTATGGGTLEWTEDYLVGSASVGVAFTSGTYQVNLGSVCAFTGGACETYTNSAINWNSYPLYLSVQIGNTTACTVTTTFLANCGGDGEMSPYILLTSTPYAFNSAELGGLSSGSYIQAAPTVAQTIQSANNVVGLTVLQNSAASPTADIFDVDTANSTGVLQIAGPSANAANVILNAVGAANNVTINPAGTGTLNLGTLASANTIQIGSTTLASGIQTINIGNDNTAGGTTNVTIGDGSAAAGGNTTVQANNTLLLQAGNTNDTILTNSDQVQTNVNSTIGFEVQNAAGDNLINADTQNGDVTLADGSDQVGGTIGTWNPATNLTTATAKGATVTYNGYIYRLGGSTTGAVGGAISTSYYAPLSANGTIGTWNPATNLPSTGTGIWGASAVAYNGYLYEWGGTNSAGTMQPTVYYSQINSNGSLGTWVAAGNNPANASFGNVGVVYNGYLYQIGDATSSAPAGAGTTSYFAPINANGTVGAWTATSTVTNARYLATATNGNGYVYLIGGTNTAGTTQTSIYYAELNSSGGLGAFNTATTTLTTAVDGAAAIYINNYLFVLGGSTNNTAAGAITTTYSVPVANNGNVTASFTPNTPLNTAVMDASPITDNGFIYNLGGLTTAGTTTTSTYYAYVFNGSSNNFVSTSANGTQVGTSSNSTSTFQVQNASGTDMIQADSLNGQVIISNGTDAGGSLSAYWANNPTDLTTAVSYAASVAYNGYIYQLGGSTGANNACATAATSPTNLTYYAPVSSSGTVGAWTAGTVLNTAVCGESAVAYNGYMYEWGGAIAAGTIQTNVYYAAINSNGSLGTWALAGNNPAVGTFGGTGVAYNGYLYQVGSDTTDAAAGATTATYYSAIAANGTVGAWTASTVVTGARYLASVTTYNGYVYVIGGDSTAGTAQTTIYYAPLSAGVGTWATTTTPLTTGTDGSAATMQNGYLNIFGGTTTNAYGGAIATSYSVPISSSGNITGTFGAVTSLPTALSNLEAVYYNDYVFEYGGVNNAGAVQSQVYSNVAYSGGQNTITTNNQGVSIGSTVNSTTSLQVENAAGTDILSVDTADDLVNIGNGTIGDSSGYLLVLDSKDTTGDPNEINGAMYYNAYSQSFRCGEAGIWENCLSGLLTSNTAPSAAVNTCTAACSAFNTFETIPANYCQPGRVITVTAYGVYSTTASITFSMGAYMGNNTTTKTSDTLIGAVSGAISSGAARTNQGFRVQFSIICDTYGATGTVNGQGVFTLDTTSAASTLGGMFDAGATTVANNTTNDILLFPTFSVSNVGDTATIEQFIVSGG
jgi:hypothetical protein